MVSRLFLITSENTSQPVNLKNVKRLRYEMMMPIICSTYKFNSLELLVSLYFGIM